MILLIVMTLYVTRPVFKKAVYLAVSKMLKCVGGRQWIKADVEKKEGGGKGVFSTERVQKLITEYAKCFQALIMGDQTTKKI